MAGRGTRSRKGREEGKKGTARSLPPLETTTTASGRGSVAPGLNCGGVGARVDGGITLDSSDGTAAEGSEKAGGAEAA
jgi:hypothetical protein